jgi:hypothetical protein
MQKFDYLVKYRVKGEDAIVTHRVSNVSSSQEAIKHVISTSLVELEIIRTKRCL